MSPNNLQFLSNFLVFIGVLLAGIGGWGNYYFGKVADKIKNNETIDKEEKLNTKIESLISGNNELKESLEPFKDLAKKRFPTEDIDTALKKLSGDLDRIEKQTAKTNFNIINENSQILEDGSYEVNFDLEPDGSNVIPLFTVTANTFDKVEIITINIEGPTIPVMSQLGTNETKTFMRNEFRSVRPGPVKITVHVASKPEKLEIGIEPLNKK